ncbi:efflux RND transporter periplasmic adaptor subunit [Actinocorallia sp. A-T 12471]|uniref:efflux RND transporter periplasmic adaptor subunit n=1 Tax=Actinocorallia sp. A-T 12471 TaxID=3089813 RepID=UPI0029CBEF25|nr:efflux RND transporter periplasmic adaptor subunit [Actinocorallia sp. A-T 12471]MDX6739292.1 efflux RND transporter periplasmic adaptor subunit [Actinocorallia sp. A-T 12471]
MKSLIKRRGVLVNGTLGVLLAGGVGVAYLSLGDGALFGEDEPASASTRTVTVSRGDLTASVSASGSVESAKSSALSFAGSGTVDEIYVKVGDKVAKGQKLAILDQTEALENLEAAQANLAVAADGDTDSTQGYAQYVQAKNAVRSAQRTLDGTVIYAPFKGTVTAVNGEEGGSSSGSSGSSSAGTAGASASSGFIEIANPSKLKVDGDFTEADTTELKVGQSATVTFNALSGVTAEGKVTAIDTEPTTTNNVVSFSVTITLTSKPAKVRIGQTSTVTVVTSEAKDVLYVPSAAVSTAGGQSTVTVVRNGTTSVVTVETGIAGTSGTEIKSGLEEGDTVQVASTGTSGSTGSGFPGGGMGGGFPGGGGGFTGGGGFGGGGGR